MTGNYLLCGVGGQGTVLASRLIAQAAMARGETARTAETIGMAQRGGCVVSHVRVGADACAPLIPLGRADALFAFEPAEAVRCLPYVRSNGAVISSIQPIVPVTAALGGSYDAERMLSYLRARAAHLVLLDAQAIAAACGTTRALNVALLGAALGCGALPFSREELLATLAQRVKPQYMALNEKALALGYEIGQSGKNWNANKE